MQFQPVLFFKKVSLVLLALLDQSLVLSVSVDNLISILYFTNSEEEILVVFVFVETWILEMDGE